jgi:hypothetical protein
MIQPPTRCPDTGMHTAGEGTFTYKYGKTYGNQWAARFCKAEVLSRCRDRQYGCTMPCAASPRS